MGFEAAGDVDCCCLEYLLATQEDFQSQENAVEEYVKGRGHLCIFLPKYHPGNATSHICSPRRVRFLCVSLALTFSRCVESQLNFIERYWGRAKWFMRDNCDYSLKELWALSERALGPENCNATLLRKYARTSWRWMDAYEKGLKGVQAAWAVRLCSKHRGISKVAEDKMNADAQGLAERGDAEAAELARAHDGDADGDGD